MHKVKPLMKKTIYDSPELMREWDPENSLDPSKLSMGSITKCKWICPMGHKYETQARMRARMGTGCPYCAGKKVSKENNLLRYFPDLALEWHPFKNEPLRPDGVTPNSNRKISWICKNNPDHQWTANISSRVKGAGCPKCSGRVVSKENNFALHYPKLVKNWHPTKNKTLSPDQVLPKSHKKMWWSCPEGHEWQASLANVTRGQGCPECVSKRARRVGLAEMLAVAEKKGGKCLSSDYRNIHSKLEWECSAGHRWVATPSRVMHSGSRCPMCSSQGETGEPVLKGKG